MQQSRRVAVDLCRASDKVECAVDALAATVKARMLRELAEECRAHAATLHGPLREEMLKIAASYDNMAEIMVHLADQKTKLGSI
jgi:hypothetical protein